MGVLVAVVTRSRQPAARNWRMAAACRHADPELFFPVSSGRPAAEQTARAKALCSGCSVQPACLQFAVDTQAEGVWGGTTEEERRLVLPAVVPVLADGGARDHQGGWPVTQPLDKMQRACLLRAEGKSYGEISSETGIPKASVYRYLSRMLP
jgi:WhiB family redox-sensing transcriptional regulator